MRKKPSPIPESGPYLETTPAGEALFLLLRAQRILVDQTDREFKSGGALSLALWEVLVVLSQAPNGRSRMVDVTKRMLVSKSNVTKLIDKLEEVGAVRRERSDADRRTIYAQLRPAGVDIVRRGGDVFNRVANEHFARHLLKHEIESVSTGLKKVVAAHQRSRS